MGKTNTLHHTIRAVGRLKALETSEQLCEQRRKPRPEPIAREIAINNRSELVVHGTDGRIREKNSYGNDPCPPKG